MLLKLALKVLAKLDGGYLYFSGIRIIYKECFGISIGYGTYGGCFDYAKVRRGVAFGSYCSIAPNVSILNANHPISSFTTHPILYEPRMGLVKTLYLVRKEITIGHGGWIGANVVILPSVRYIGNGSVIGAVNIVTEDVPPFSIVAGNPAKLIRMRFDSNVMEQLEAS